MILASQKPSKGIFGFYALSIFLSAFLIFQIQPMLAKYMLPYFGGTASVWAVSLLFFTTALFLGYLYAFLLSKLPLKRQLFTHALLLLLGTGLVFYSLATRSQLAIDLDKYSESGLQPSLLVLITLSTSIAIPYILLASTSPLFQQYFTLTHNKEPYKLYAVSNAGSFGALISYPFLIEPNMNLKYQQFVWGALFIIFIAFALFIMAKTLKQSGTRQDHSLEESENTSSKSHPYVKWLSFSLLPSFILVASTTYITQKISPIPLLWIVPLALYLLSFVIAFAGVGNIKLYIILMLVAISAGARGIASYTGVVSIGIGVLAFLFLTSLFCHFYLYELRPDKKQSSLFYVYTSAGGAIGALLASIFPPLVFDKLSEMNLALIFSILVTIYVYLSSNSLKKTRMARYSVFAVASFCIVALILTVLPTTSSKAEFATRNFYGTHSVEGNDELKQYFNNNILHGSQIKEPSERFNPTSYYYESTGLYQAIEIAKKNRGTEQVNIGIVGLGIGVNSFHCIDSNVSMTYYEIDRQVEKIAKEHFTFIDLCKDSEVVIGDGRVLLNQELQKNKSREFDVLLLDAFSGGSIPTHLMTTEALEIYKQHMRNDESIIVFHTTNAWLDLPKVVAKLAVEAGMDFRYVATEQNLQKYPYTYRSSYLLVAQNRQIFDENALQNVKEVKNMNSAPLWTDNYTNLLSALKL